MSYTILFYGPQRYTVPTEHVPMILRMAPWLREFPKPANDTLRLAS